MSPFWVTAKNAPFGWELGVGVTGFDERDAITMVDLMRIDGFVIDSITHVRSHSDLDQGHVVPNMGNILARGVWYPLGYSDFK